MQFGYEVWEFEGGTYLLIKCSFFTISECVQ